MIVTCLAWILYEEIEILNIESLILKFICREWKCRVEVTVQTALCPDRNLPDTEESEDMVDTECVEILRHLRKT